MAGLIKLKENEKNILRLEEEVLRNLISQYQGALNALKVEELTLTNRLGRSQDLVRQSRKIMSTSLHTPTTDITGLRNLPILSSQINSTDSIIKPLAVHDAHVNQRTLNLSASPSINKVIAAYEEDEEDE